MPSLVPLEIIFPTGHAFGTESEKVNLVKYDTKPYMRSVLHLLLFLALGLVMTGCATTVSLKEIPVPLPQDYQYSGYSAWLLALHDEYPDTDLSKFIDKLSWKMNPITKTIDVKSTPYRIDGTDYEFDLTVEEHKDPISGTRTITIEDGIYTRSFGHHGELFYEKAIPVVLPRPVRIIP